MADTPTALDRLRAHMQHSGCIDTDPVDFVEFLLTGVQSRDLDALADDIVCFVLRWDDLVAHVRDRLDVQKAYADAEYMPPAADTRRAAESIVAAIRAIVQGRLMRTFKLPPVGTVITVPPAHLGDE